MVKATLSTAGNEVIYRRAHNIGFALASPAGLVVPNVKAVEQRSLLDVAKEVGGVFFFC